MQAADPCRFSPIVALGGDEPGRAAPYAMEVSHHREAHVRLTCAIGALIAAQQEGKPPMAVMVSLSPEELERLDIASLTGSLVAAAVAPDLLMIRVPHYVAGVHAPILDKLTTTGVTVVAASLVVRAGEIALLAGAPIDMIELPQALVEDVDRSRESADRIEEWMAIAHRVDWLVLARNVRRLSQARALERLGCDLAAGPLMGAPVDPVSFGGSTSQGNRLAG